MGRSLSRVAVITVVTVTVATLAVAGCSRDKSSPEQQVLRTIAQGLAAAERRSVDDLRDLVTDNFQDNHGHDRRQILGLLRIYFLQHQSIHLFAQTKSIRFPDPHTADAIIVVAMAGQPIETPEAAERLRASIYRFEMRFVSGGGGTWKASRANWDFAQLSDFF